MTISILGRFLQDAYIPRLLGPGLGVDHSAAVEVTTRTIRESQLEHKGLPRLRAANYNYLG